MKQKLIVFLAITFIIFISVNNRTIANNNQFNSNYNETHRIIEFSGQQWVVESYMDEKVNPGPNYFSSSDDHVWVDQRDFLVLNVQKNPSGQWVSSSVKSLDPVSYGIHRFKVIGNIEKMDKNIVLGLFLYRIDPDFPEKRAEIDIEFSTWGLPYETNEGTIEATTNGHYTLWKPWNEGKDPKTQAVESFWIKMPRGTHTTHEIKWSNNEIEFHSFHGHSTTNPHRVIINQFSLINDNTMEWHIPHKDDKMHVMLNLWIHGNNDSPYENNEIQMKIKYEFEPLSDL